MSYANGEKFRFNVSLRAPTAIVKNISEIPVTYLNKAQPYNLSVIDTSPPIGNHEPLRYRTFIRVSFEERELRIKPRKAANTWIYYKVVATHIGTDRCKSRTANPTTSASGYNIPVRFNFLSTDFSHSKGVKGIAIRLCAKTELLSPGEEVGVSRDTELSYYKVKLFWDHSAKRKLSNNVTHVNKNAEVGGFTKRKRGNNASTSLDSEDVPLEKVSLEDDL
ncbi:hypothetical protein N7497_012303 [Penicillium chrysogenum]|nr:hypothetical protein N7497_012303 [Penicillium chrysogenum]